MTIKSSWAAVTFAIALMVLPASSGAQTPATSLADLRPLLQPGHKVLVTDAAGKQTRGKVVSVTTSTLDIVTETPRFLILKKLTDHSFAETGLTSVKRIDSQIDGALIGFAAVFVPLILAPCDGVECDGRVFWNSPLAILGAGIGAFVDGRINKTVYQSGPRAGAVTIHVSPLTNRTAGAALSLRF